MDDTFTVNVIMKRYLIFGTVCLMIVFGLYKHKEVVFQIQKLMYGDPMSFKVDESTFQQIRIGGRWLVVSRQTEKNQISLPFNFYGLALKNSLSHERYISIAPVNKKATIHINLKSKQLESDKLVSGCEQNSLCTLKKDYLFIEIENGFYILYLHYPISIVVSGITHSEWVKSVKIDVSHSVLMLSSISEK